MNDFLVNLAEVLAHSTVFFARAQAEGDPVGFDFTSNTAGGSQSGTSTSSTAFSRQGTETAGADWALPSWLSSLIQQAPTQSAMPQGLVNNDWSFLTNLIQQDPAGGYGIPTLNDILNIDPTNFNGAQGLDTIMARNPYSQDYENATRGLYDRQFEIARSNAQSGPANVRGGQARVGFDLADVGTQESLNRFREVRGQQDKEASIVEQATEMGNRIESMRRGSQLQAQGMGQASQSQRTGQSMEGSAQVTRNRAANAALLQQAAELLGTKQTQNISNLTGEGQQIQSSSGVSASSGSGFGVGGSPCCFIFLEALNGVLPLYVRWGRDDFQTENRRRGYVWMSRWLVPWMRRSRVTMFTVNTLLVRPFLHFGRALYVHPRPLVKLLVGAYCWLWFGLWSLLGRCKQTD